ncbi:MAG: HEPN domain-containing protein [Chloroflexi bacterium]|nr:HEPN domain-containing protein [Chloroflexota bacterium]
MRAEPFEEWIDKAEEDFRLALVAMRQKKYPAYNGACFHAQQCGEKYLKGFLTRHQIGFRKTHDLDELRVACAEIDRTFNLVKDWAIALTPYAIDVRYPGESVNVSEARTAIQAMKELRKFVRARLGLKTR